MTKLIVAKLAEEQGLNITTLARKAELSYTTVHALWHDSAKVWNRESLDSLALALGVQVADMIQGKPDRASKRLRRSSV